MDADKVEVIRQRLAAARIAGFPEPELEELLAERELLREQIATSVLDRTVYPTGAMVGTTDRYVEDRLALQRAALRSAVEAMPSSHEVDAGGTDNLTIDGYLDRADVLALLGDPG